MGGAFQAGHGASLAGSKVGCPGHVGSVARGQVARVREAERVRR